MSPPVDKMSSACQASANRMPYIVLDFLSLRAS